MDIEAWRRKLEGGVPKERTRVPDEVAAEVLFRSDFTCCICREKGKTVQIHHIDEKPSNGDPENLAVLCLECHNMTQIRGGFGKNLGPEEVAMYRKDWITRVQTRRDKADELAAQAMAGLGKPDLTKHSSFLVQNKPLFVFVNSLPDAKAEAIRRSKPGWDSVVTSEMLNANYTYVEFLQGVLLTLASFYESKPFNSPDPRYYFSSLIASRYYWHRAACEPGGPGSSGTSLGVSVGRAVASDAEAMISEMVAAISEQLLGEHRTDFNLKRWRALWESAR